MPSLSFHIEFSSHYEAGRVPGYFATDLIRSISLLQLAMQVNQGEVDARALRTVTLLDLSLLSFRVFDPQFLKRLSSGALGEAFVAIVHAEILRTDDVPLLGHALADLWLRAAARRQVPTFELERLTAGSATGVIHDASLYFMDAVEGLLKSLRRQPRHGLPMMERVRELGITTQSPTVALVLSAVAVSTLADTSQRAHVEHVEVERSSPRLQTQSSES